MVRSVDGSASEVLHFCPLMKKDLHPTEYRPMVIKDSNSGFAFLTRSSAQTDETIDWEDGNTYPLLTVHISSASHPFYTGEEKIVDVEGRVDKFKARQEAASARKDARSNKAKRAAAKQKVKTKTKDKTKIGQELKSANRKKSDKAQKDDQ